MFATTLPLAASKTDWSEFLPEKLVPAIGDTFYMVSITMLCAGLVGLVVGALLYTTRTGNIFQNRFVYTILNILVNVIRPIPFIILIAALGPLTSAVVGTRLGVNAAGASKMTILFTVMIPEALGPLILGYTFLVIGVVDMSAMAGYVGAGGLGKIAIVDGYQRFNDEITWAVVAIIIVLVQLVQFIGNALAKKVMRR